MSTKKFGLTTQIIIALIAGIAFGIALPDQAKSFGIGSDIFLRLVKSIIAPLIFSMLVVGIAGHGNIKSIGKLGIRTLVYFEIVTTLALAVGLIIVNIFRPGDGLSLAGTNNAIAESIVSTAEKSNGLEGIILHTFPTSIIDAMARGDVLQIVVFAVIFACAVGAVGGTKIIALLEELTEVMFKYTGYVMILAPLGVFCAIASCIGTHGLGVLWNLSKLVLTLYFALFVFIAIVLLPIALYFKVSLPKFYQAVKEPFLIAFSTASSEAALPKVLENLKDYGVPQRISGFVLPLGYSFNLDGSTLYLALASIFIAQAAHIELSISTQLLMMLTLMLTSKGIAGVPRASLVILAGCISTFNLPMAGIALLLGVDALMDMARTSINLLGNCLACVAMSKLESSPQEPIQESTEVVDNSLAYEAIS